MFYHQDFIDYLKNHGRLPFETINDAITEVEFAEERVDAERKKNEELIDEIQKMNEENFKLNGQI